MHQQSPSVMRLDTHLENDQTFVFNDDEKVKDVKNKNKNTKLTAFFLLNSTDDDAKKLLYHDIPKYYVWKYDKKNLAKKKKTESI